MFQVYIIYLYSLLFIFIHYYSLLFIIIHYYSLLFIIIHLYLYLFGGCCSCYASWHRGFVASLRFSPPPPPPASWEALHRLNQVKDGHPAATTGSIGRGETGNKNEARDELSVAAGLQGVPILGSG